MDTNHTDTINESKTIIRGTKVPITSWAGTVEETCMQQAKNIANSMPVYDHFALMADAHTGYGMPIGGVLPLIEGISPSAVGSDIGCGVVMLQPKGLKTEDISKEIYKKIYGEIREAIPVGFNHHKDKQDWEGFTIAPKSKIIQQELQSAAYQLGTLGGGNHFIEIQKDSDNDVYIMIHSGSRNLGKRIADYYSGIAIKDGIVPDGHKDLAYFPTSSPYFSEYYEAMGYALAFAKENRFQMIYKIWDIFKKHLGLTDIQNIINIHHNYAEEAPFICKGVYLHRKGATSASLGQFGLIPGSMAGHSYIVQGRGNSESFLSCSHGAGRIMSRGQAKRTITPEDYWNSLQAIGLDVGDRNPRDLHLDESSLAYKSPEDVIKRQQDLVHVVTVLTPFGLPAIKG